MAKNKVIPNAFLIGAAKCGTTSIGQWLSQHPDVYTSPIKEPNYFNTDVNPENFVTSFKNNLISTEGYFNQNPLPYLQQAFIRSEADYERLFKESTAPVNIEFSTNYLLSEVALQQIKAVQPQAKIIVALRHPIARTFSHYQMALRFGFTHKSLEKAIEDDQALPHKGIGRSEMYLEHSLYTENLKRVYSVFPKDQVHVILFETLQSQPQEVLNELFSFLDIKPQNIDTEKKENSAKTPKNAKLNKFINDSGMKQWAKRMLPKKVQSKIIGAMMDENTAEITKEQYLFLAQFLEPEIENFKRTFPHIKVDW